MIPGNDAEGQVKDPLEDQEGSVRDGDGDIIDLAAEIARRAEIAQLGENLDNLLRDGILPKH